MSVSDAKKPITRSLALGEESIGAIREILKEGIGINVQSVPFEKPIDFCDLCDSYMLCSASQ
jgi:mannose/fructose/N-acetylgalactosamine-specific phosphotransferase system component IIB